MNPDEQLQIFGTILLKNYLNSSANFLDASFIRLKQTS